MVCAQSLYSSEPASAGWTTRFDKIKAQVIFPGDPGFKKFLYNVSEIYINDSPKKSGLMYDGKLNSPEEKNNVLALIQRMRDIGAVNHEAITILLDQDNKQIKHVLRVRFKGF